MEYVIGAVMILAWVILLGILHKSGLNFWKFLVGSTGLFLIMMVYARPVLTMPLARIVAAIAGVFGQLTGMFSSYFKYGIIFVESVAGSISLTIDFECSGIIEIMAFVSLLAFYKVYDGFERILVGILGVCAIVLSNALRIGTICTIIHFYGVDAYYVSHAFIGRIIFYGLSVALYFYVFTKPQILKQKVGAFRYDK